MDKFRKAFIPNPVGRFDDKLSELADEVIPVCPTPIYDTLIDDDDMLSAYKNRISKILDDFNPELDVMLDYGDPLIFAMMIYYLADSDKITVGRYNRKTEKYVFHNICPWWDADGDEDERDNTARH